MPKKAKIVTVICIDTSGSTSGATKYFEKVASILKNERNKMIIVWNSRAYITKSTNFVSCGGTRPQTFLKIIKRFSYEFNLIVTTDGQINNYDVHDCKQIIDESNLMSKIKSFKMYFIGDIKEMNLKISSPFNKLKDKQIIINDDEPIRINYINLVEELKYEDFKDEKGIVASILALLQDNPGKRDEIRSQICKVANRIIGELASKSSIKEFYEKNDIDSCMEFVRKYDNSHKKKFQKAMSKILDIFKKQDDYSLSHLSNTNTCKKQTIKADNMDYEDGEIDDQDFICDILLTKCSYPCILVKLIEDTGSENKDKFSIIPDKLSKKIAEHPFLILNHADIIQKIIKRVEHQMMDLYAYNNLEDKLRSPFTRDDLKGVFIFHNDEANYDLIFKNNNRTLSFIFGKDNKLPGNKAIWNVLFLYIYVEGSENFLEFYSYISGGNFEDMNNKIKIWNVWKYFCRNRVNKNLKLEVLSQKQNHEIINGSIILLSGESRCNVENESKCGCRKFHVKPEVVIKLYDIFKTKSNPKLYDCLDYDVIANEDKIEDIVIKDNFNEELLEHVGICLETLKPTVTCPVTGKHWKECSGGYNVNTESYVKEFKRFCTAKKKYPADGNELLAFYSDRINFNNKEVVICPLNIKNCLNIVLNKYSDVIKEYPIEKYLKICNEFCSEADRLKIEKSCKRCSFHKY